MRLILLLLVIGLQGCCRDVVYYKPNYGGRWYDTVAPGRCFPYSVVTINKEDLARGYIMY